MEELVIIAVCIALNALFSAVEMAFVSVTRVKLKSLAKSGNKDASLILSLRDNPERTLSVIQVGITIVGAIAAAVGGAGAQEWLAPYLQKNFNIGSTIAEAASIILIVLPLTYLSVVFGELVPKTVALKNPQNIILRSARWLAFFDKVFTPLVTALENSTKIIVRLLFPWTKRRVAETSPEPLDIGQLTQQHRQYVLNLVNMESKTVKDIMLPWNEVNALQIGCSVSDVENVVVTSGHTRLPVLNADEVVGILHSKEFLKLLDSGSTDWQSIIRPIVRLDAKDPLLKALKIMQDRRSHLSLVQFEGRKIGIVTLEDVLEEVVGDIYDEDDDRSFVLRRKWITNRLRAR